MTTPYLGSSAFSSMAFSNNCKRMRSVSCISNVTHLDFISKLLGFDLPLQVLNEISLDNTKLKLTHLQFTEKLFTLTCLQESDHDLTDRHEPVPQNCICETRERVSNIL